MKILPKVILFLSNNLPLQLDISKTITDRSFKVRLLIEEISRSICENLKEFFFFF